MCWPAAELEVAKRLFGHLHEKEPWHDGSFRVWAKEFSPATPWHYADGTSIYLAEIDEKPWDDFLGNKFADPRPSVAQQSPGEQDQPGD